MTSESRPGANAPSPDPVSLLLADLSARVERAMSDGCVSEGTHIQLDALALGKATAVAWLDGCVIARA